MLKSKMFDDIYQVGEHDILEFKAYLGGKWVFGKELRDVKSPIDGKTIARISNVSNEQIEETLGTMHKIGKEKIRNYSGEKRIKSFLKAAHLIHEALDDFVNVLVLDAGKPKENAKGETKATIERLEKTTMESKRLTGDYVPGDWSHDTLESEGIVKREPYGITLAISPFNYPLFISATKITPSLLSGNAVILKPSSADPIAPLLFTKVLELSGFPKESFATLTMSGSDMRNLVGDRRIDTITFTGSTEIGKDILRNAGIKNFHMELGGKDPAIVLADAKLDQSIEELIKGMVGYSGQRCDAIRLILAEEAIYESLKEKLVEKLKTIEPKNPLEDESAIMGPLISEKSSNYIEEICTDNDALEKGAKPLLEFKRSNNYVWPVLLEADKEILQNIRAFQEDVFGPFTLLIKVNNEDEAIEIANSSKFGLDAAIFGEDQAKIRKIVRKLDVGAVFINAAPRHGTGYYPFGGMKDSGMGREGIGYSIDQFTTTKTIVQHFKGRGIWEYI
jgi:glyceraldehyde-3-phosphate dehydrogenase [NAD(P)+]